MAYHAHLTQANDRVGLIVMASIFCVTAVTAVLARLYARRLKKAKLGADDWLAVVALIFVLALNGIFLGGTIQGAITGHSPVENNWPVSTPLEHLAEKYKYAFQMTEKITFGLIKLSLLFLWKRIFFAVRGFRLLCWVMIGVVIAWSISFFFATVFQCGTHWSWNWAPITLFLTQCSNTLNMLTVFCATDVFTDFIIMFMPVPMIWSLQLPVQKKLGITSIFMVGLFTIGAGIARMYIYLTTSYDKEDNPDFIADFTLFMLWSEIEANVAIIVCCMPTFVPVLARCRDVVLSTLPSSISKWSLLSRKSGYDHEKRSNNVRQNSGGSYFSDKSDKSDGVYLGPHDSSVVGLKTTAEQGSINEDLEQGLYGSEGIYTQTRIVRTTEANASRSASPYDMAYNSR